MRQQRMKLETKKLMRSAGSENGQKAGAPADGGNDQPAGGAGAPNDKKNGQKQ